MYVPRAMNSFRMSFCTVPESFRKSAPCFFATAAYSDQQDRGRGVDRHGRGHPVQGNPGEQDFHVFERIDGHADFSHFSGGTRMIRIVADLRRQIESD